MNMTDRHKGTGGISSAPSVAGEKGMLTYFETDIPITNAVIESVSRLAKDRNRSLPSPPVKSLAILACPSPRSIIVWLW